MGGKWQEKFVTTPAGGSTKVFIGLDKSNRTIFIQNKLKAVKRAVIALSPEEDPEQTKCQGPSKRSPGVGKVLHRQVAICRCEATGYDAWEYKWDFAALDTVKLTKEGILNEIERNASERDAAEASRWRS